ncbi:MAG: diacylglycerol kinase [Armatimonadetes bacterium]|nr:diacylglycerol kinase [Armatimonadota bacterium]
MRNIFKPFSNALAGVVYAFKTQRHMRFHMYIVVLVVLLGLFVGLRVREIMVLMFIISLVLVAEMFNSAIEAIVDMVKPGFHPLAKLAKDMSAGAVLITSVTAVVVALLLMLGEGRWERIIVQISSPGRQFLHQDNVAVAARIVLGFFVLLVLIVIGKGLGKRGQVFKGGMVSGHAAFGFFLAVTVIFLSNNLLVSLIAIFLASMVAQSRWERRIHSLFELSLGATLGGLLAILLFGLETL